MMKGLMWLHLTVSVLSSAYPAVCETWEPKQKLIFFGNCDPVMNRE